jgi:spermidine synthase
MPTGAMLERQDCASGLTIGTAQPRGDMDAIEQDLSAPGRSAPRGVGLFALTVVLSAFLLFQVQPLVSKQILPWFGGSPGVWTAAMLFFQTLLFGGYLYSHLITHRLSMRVQAWAHLSLLAVASLLALFVLPGASARATIGDDPLLSILRILATSVGVPYLCLATTAPLIQYWFARTQPEKAAYRLYALSNAGSLIALLSFPYLFEPSLALPQIGRLWTWLFWLFALSCAALTLLVKGVDGSRPGGSATPDRERRPNAADMPTIGQRIAWVALPALGSLLFVATTDHVSHDIAPEPRVWIGTLSLYLLTFIICFDHARWYRRAWVAAAYLLTSVALTGRLELEDWLGLELDFGVTELRAIHFAAMFLGCFLCHGELFRIRPRNARYMTEFYLWISFGGAVGGLFVALVCTNVFADYYEWTLSVIGAASLACLVLASEVLGARELGSAPFEKGVPAVRTLRGWPARGALCGAVGFAVVIVYFSDPFKWRIEAGSERTEMLLHQSRNFYGAITVTEIRHRQTPTQDYRIFYSGDVVHGLQFTDPAKRRSPVSYHSESSGVGETLLFARARQSSLRVAIVGLGAGTLATYAREADRYDFYEINPAVVEVATALFTNLSDCLAHEKRLILGDARLRMEEMPADVLYDVIALDAFTGSSVPVHLMTREAFQIYRRHLKPDGFIVVNITNRYLNFYPIVRLQAEALSMGYRYKSLDPKPEQQVRRSRHFVITDDQEYLSRYPSVYGSRVDAQGNLVQLDEPDLPGISLWTDQFSSISSIQFRD